MYANRLKQLILAGFALGFVVLFGACTLEEEPSPTSSSPTEVGSSEGQPTLATAPSTVPPAIVSPESGEEVSSQSPLLTVKNATTDGEPTYTFQVASDRGFNDIVARAEGIPEGSDGQTSWQIQKKLSAQKHFWRVYADLGTIRLTSMIANFIVPRNRNRSSAATGTPSSPMPSPMVARSGKSRAGRSRPKVGRSRRRITSSATLSVRWSPATCSSTPGACNLPTPASINSCCSECGTPPEGTIGRTRFACTFKSWTRGTTDLTSASDGLRKVSSTTRATLS